MPGRGESLSNVPPLSFLVNFQLSPVGVAPARPSPFPAGTTGEKPARRGREDQTPVGPSGSRWRRSQLEKSGDSRVRGTATRNRGKRTLDFRGLAPGPHPLGGCKLRALRVGAPRARRAGWGQWRGPAAARFGPEPGRRWGASGLRTLPASGSAASGSG